MNKYLNYRPEIDGLRALAVLSVIFYHSTVLLFEKKFLPGGFIGVDIFFVISGYLITKIIYSEIKKTNNFSFLNFYKRRIKRIIPALLFVIILTFPLIYHKTSPNFFIDYAKSIISIIFFISNIFFWSLGVGYDQLQNVQFQPFLHAWTLSLEEQFYFFFPLVFFIILKKFKKKIFLIIALGFLSSLILCDYMSFSHASVNFYFLPTRAWEFLAGSLLVLIEKKDFSVSKKIFNSFYITLGLSLIIFSILFFDDRMYLPSIISLIPILGVCLIIHFSFKENFFIKILSSKIFLSIGKISYSLYLWHYPIFLIYPNVNFLIQILLIFLFSLISYFFVEKKFRYNAISNIYSIKTIIAFSLIILGLMINFLILSKKVEYDKYPIILQHVLKEKFLKDVQPDINLNKNSTDEEKINLYIAGDSHMKVLSNELSRDIRFKNYNLIDQNLSNGCYYVYNFERVRTLTGKKVNPCSKADQAMRKENFLSKQNSIVILGGRLPLWLNQEESLKQNYFNRLMFRKKNINYPSLAFINEDKISLEEGIVNSIYDLLANDIKVILVYPVPILNFNPVKKIFDYYFEDKENFQSNLKNNPFTVSYNEFLTYAKKSHNILNSLNHPNLHKVFTDKLFCDKKLDKCLSHNQNEIFYIDNNHLSSFGNKKIVDQILNLIK